MASEPRWSFLGFDLRDDMPEKWPPNIPIRDERDGSYVYRAHTAEYVGVPRRRRAAA